MRDQLPGLLERADLALASCNGVLEARTLAPLAASVAVVRARLSYPDDVAVVALAGGTGSGKSSLFNALVGEELSDVGGIRPTTGAPLAAVPTEHADSMAGYLDAIGIEHRATYTGDDICLIDLPDTDSVETDHRHQVDSLLGVVDLVIWVVDPEKYRDARLHHDYLKTMAPYSRQFLFVFNQIDRLSDEEQAELVGDLEAAIADDGIPNPVVVPVAANPVAGPPMGIDSLRSAIAERLEPGDLVYEKLLTDLEATARALVDAAGSGLDFDRRAKATVDEAIDDVMTGEEGSATQRLVTLLDSLSREAGGVTGGRIRALAADVPGHVARIAGRVRPVQPARRWWPFRGGFGAADPVNEAQTLIGEAVIRPVRALLARRAVAVASVADLSLEVSRIRAMTKH